MRYQPQPQPQPQEDEELPRKRIEYCHNGVYMENQWSEEKGEELRIARLMFIWRR